MKERKVRQLEQQKLAQAKADNDLEEIKKVS